MRRSLPALALRRRLRSGRHGGDESGFTILEVVIASMVVMIALLALPFVYTSALGTVDFSQQTQTGAGLANQAVEQVRALRFSTVAAGLSSASSYADLTGDSAISHCAAPNASLYCFGGEIIPTTSSTPPAPLYPHKAAAVTIGHTAYTVAVYVTEYLDTTSPNVLRVTAVVSWTPAAKQGVAASTSVVTLDYDGGSGCLTGTNHPFYAPCQASFFASASDHTGGVTLTPDSTYGTPVSLTTAQLSYPLVQGSLQIDQVSTVSGGAQNSGVALNFGSTADSQGTSEQTETVSTSEANGSPVVAQSGATTSQTGQTYTVSDAAGSSLAVTGSGGASEVGDAYATSSASTTNHCYDFSSLAQTDSLPCSSANATQAQALTSTLDVKNGTDLGSATLASLGAGATKTFLTNVGAALGSSYCTSTTGDGCVDVRATRTVGTTTLGGLPAHVTAPGGWSGYFVQISNWTDTVTAEDGQGTATPTATASGTISYWNGSNYTNLTVGSGSTVATTPSVTVSGSGYTVKETLTQLSAGTTTKSDPDNCTSPCTRKGPTTASSSSPQIIIDYQITYGTETWGVTITLNLGTLAVSSNYGASPSAS